MKFNEKMIFLMETTRTSNKVLAEKINVDPSMISLLRTGRRGKPRNEEHIRAMADYFATQFRTMYQRETLGDVIGHFNLKYKSDYQDISPILYEWLKNDNYQVPSALEHTLAGLYKYTRDDSVTASGASEESGSSNGSDSLNGNASSNGFEPSNGFGSSKVSGFSNQGSSVSASPDSSFPPSDTCHGNNSLNSVLQETSAFYGDDGKREAISRFHDFSQKFASENSVIYFSADESNGLYFSDNAFSSSVAFWKKLLADTGCRMTMILPPPHTSIFLDILAGWLPIFLSGNVDVYYYPRTRDRIYRKTMLILDGKAACFCNSIDGMDSCAFTILTRDPALVEANHQIFESFISKCNKTLHVYRDLEDIQNCFLKYVGIQTDSILLSNTLPQSSMPFECMQKLFPDKIEKTFSAPEELTPAEVSYRDYRTHGYDRYRNHVTIEISPLANAADVAAGKIEQYYPVADTSRRYPYTPETYALHLKNLVDLMKNFPNYYFIPYNRSKYPFESVLIKENRYCLIVHHTYPAVVMEIDQAQLIQPFYEFLTDIADSAHYSGGGKLRIINQLESRIAELEKLK